MSIDPRGLSLIDWADSMAHLLPSDLNLIRLDNEDAWHRWGANIIESPTIAAQSPPRPYNFDDWREWAFQFNLTVDIQG